MSASGQSDDAVSGGQRRGQVIKLVRRSSEPRQQNERPAGTTPVQDLQLYVVIDRYRLHGMWRWILPGSLLRKQNNQNGQKVTAHGSPPVRAMYRVLSEMKVKNGQEGKVISRNFQLRHHENIAKQPLTAAGVVLVKN